MNEQSIFFRALCPELRLMVYSQLVPNFKGDIKDLQGIFLSCKLMKYETEHELSRVFQKALDATLTHLITQWDDEFNAPLLVTQAGFYLHERELTIELPISVFREVKQRREVELNVSDDILRRLCLILEPLLKFHFRKLTFSVYLDGEFIPPPPFREPTFGRLLEDFLFLLCQGYYQRVDSLLTNNDLSIGNVMSKRVVFDWAAIRLDVHNECEFKARGVGIGTDRGWWYLEFALYDMEDPIHEGSSTDDHSLLARSVPYLAVWSRIESNP